MNDIVLQTRGLTKAFGSLVACDDVSLSLNRGEIHAVIGPNGAGKSTLIAQICGGLKPDAGHVEFLGQNIEGLNTRQRALAGLGRTFQVSALAMEDTVLQNAILGALGSSGNTWRFFKHAMKDQDLRERAEHALKRVGLDDSLETRTAELSHGQRRQLEVAIALTLNPKTFVMDEPMAGLGRAESAALVKLLSDLRGSLPMLLVEHDMDAIFQLADTVHVLVDGRIVAHGTPDEVRADPAARAAYLGEGSA